MFIIFNLQIRETHIVHSFMLGYLLGIVLFVIVVVCYRKERYVSDEIIRENKKPIGSTFKFEVTESTGVSPDYIWKVNTGDNVEHVRDVYLPVAATNLVGGVKKRVMYFINKKAGDAKIDLTNRKGHKVIQYDIY